MLEQLEGDLQVAMHRALDARDADERRRAMRDVLATLYAAYEYAGAGRHAKRAPDGASAYQHGCCEALMVCRVIDQHAPGAAFEYRRRPLYPSKMLVPSDWLRPGSNLCVARRESLDAAFAAIRRREGRAALVERAGLPVLPMIAAAFAYLRWLSQTP